MLSFEEFQATVSAEKNLLTFEEFQAQVLKVFKCHWIDCDFNEVSYAFVADVYFPKYPNMQFVVRYIIDPENCNYGQWAVLKRYEKLCIETSDSLTQALSAVSKRRFDY